MKFQLFDSKFYKRFERNKFTKTFLFALPHFRTMPAELDDIELRSVQLQQSHSRDSISNACDLRRVPTDKGDILVAIQGDISKPAILTLHDLGLNCKWKKFRCESILINLAFRCLNLYGLLQLSDHASSVRELLRLPCYRSRTGRRRANLPRRVKSMALRNWNKK